VLRVGRERVELWNTDLGGCLGGTALESPVDAAAIERAIAQLLERQPRPHRTVVVVVESAWSPVMALPAGSWRWNLEAQLAGLLRHRLEALYEGAADPVATWTLRIDYRPGDANAIGYALPATVRAAIERALRAGGTAVSALHPAFSWGRGMVERRAWRRADWWLWLEQDRTIVARLDRAQVVALQPAAPVLADGADALRLVCVEATRLGVEGVGNVALGGWQAPTPVPAGMAWAPVVAERELAAVAAAGEVRP
jgi:hypothetical protein